MRAPALGGDDFPATLRALAEDGVRGTGLTLDCTVEGVPRPLDPKVEAVVFRVEQEAIANVVKHAAARTVRLVDDNKIPWGAGHRVGDVPLLARHFAKEFARRIGKPVEQIDGRAMDRLVLYDWPGNVRELANVLERAVILCQGSAILEADLGMLKESGPPAGDTFLTLKEMERQHIIRVLRESRGVLSGPEGAARRLGLARTTLQSKMQRLGIKRGDYSDPKRK